MSEKMENNKTTPVKKNLDYTIPRLKEHKPMPIEHVAAAPYFDSHEDVLAQAQSNYSCAMDAILELTDNPIDAGAKNIDLLLTFEDNGEAIIVISDDGSGMTADIVKDRYFLIRKDPNARSNNSLGKWGMGAKGALAYLGGRAQAYSKMEGMVGNIIYGQNYDGLIDVDAPVAVINREKFPREYVEMENVWRAWNRYEHGTMVIIRDLRPGVEVDCKNNGRAAFISELEERIGLAYGRNFIAKGLNFRINGNLIKAIDITSGGTLLLDANGNPFQGKVTIKDPNQPKEKGVFKWRVIAHKTRQKHSKVCVDRQGRFVESGIHFGNTELKKQNEWDRHQILVELDDKCDGMFGIAANKTMKTALKVPAYKALMAALKPALNFVKENAPISTVTSAEIAEECIALTEKDLQEMVVAFDRRVAAKGYKIQKPVPQNPFGGSSSSTSTKVYDPKIGSFTLKTEFVNAGVLKHNYPVEFEDSLSLGGRHEVLLKLNLNDKVNISCFTNKMNSVNGIRKARIEELLNYRIVQDEGYPALKEMMSAVMITTKETTKLSLDIN